MDLLVKKGKLTIEEGKKLTQELVAEAEKKKNAVVKKVKKTIKKATGKSTTKKKPAKKKTAKKPVKK